MDCWPYPVRLAATVSKAVQPDRCHWTDSKQPGRKEQLAAKRCPQGIAAERNSLYCQLMMHLSFACRSGFGHTWKQLSEKFVDAQVWGSKNRFPIVSQGRVARNWLKSIGPQNTSVLPLGYGLSTGGHRVSELTHEFCLKEASLERLGDYLPPVILVESFKAVEQVDRSLHCGWGNHFHVTYCPTFISLPAEA